MSTFQRQCRHNPINSNLFKIARVDFLTNQRRRYVFQFLSANQRDENPFLAFFNENRACLELLIALPFPESGGYPHASLLKKHEYITSIIAAILVLVAKP
jgi:hypothetical protein